MKTIKSIQDIYELRNANLFSESYLDYLQRFLEQLFEALSDGESIEHFSLEEHGYFVILEEEDNLRDLRDVGLNPQDQGLLGSFPEYIEKEILADGLEIYKIAVLYDNDYMMFFFSVVGQHDFEFEEWLKDNLFFDENLLTLIQDKQYPTNRSDQQ